MRILFIGAVEFSEHCLSLLIENAANVVAVVTLDRERATFNSDFADLSSLSERAGIELVKVQNINHPDNVVIIKRIDPDVIFVFGWSQIISKEVLDIPALGCIGTHPAMLPLNRGRHPIIWSIVDGLEYGGLSFFFLDEGADSGDILWQQRFTIDIEDDARSVYDKVKSLASLAIREFLPLLESGNPTRIPQNHDLATYRRKRGRKDGEIIWSSNTMQIYNLIRGLTRPYVGAHTFYNGQEVKVWSSKLPECDISYDSDSSRPGMIVNKRNGALDVRTGSGYITLTEIDLDLGDAHVLGCMLGDMV